MNENTGSLLKICRKFALLAVLATGTMFVVTLNRATAQPPPTDCNPNYSFCITSCGQPGSPGYSSCVSNCNWGGVQCQNGGGTLACESIFSSCGGLSGTDIGGCYGDFASCEATSYGRHYAMLQEPPTDEDPCIGAAVDDYWICRAGPDPEGICGGLEGGALISCCAGVRDGAREACLP
jgi:hypothetical protein